MSTTAGPRSPGWHPDPDGGDHLRHWNGRRWGEEKRPRPSWAGGRDGGDQIPAQPPRRARSPRRWLVWGAAVSSIVLLALVVGVSTRGPRIPPRSVTDLSFTRRAEAACKDVLPELRAQRPQPGERTKDEAELVAEKVERTADGLEELVARLRALPVSAADRGRVDRWLDDWTSYIAVGRRYSTGLRQGDNDAPARASREGDPLTRRVYLFSRSNGMSSCVL